MKDKYFYFYQHRAEIEIFGTLQVYIDNVHTEDDILNLYNKQLRFPSYFGYNWDALKDILCYLNEWVHIPEHTHPLIPVELSLQEQQ